MSTTTEILGLFKQNYLLTLMKLLIIIGISLVVLYQNKTSQLTNDSSFLTKHQDLSNYVKKTDTNIAYGTNNFSVVFGSKVSLAVCGEYSWNQVTKVNKLTVSNFTIESDASSSQSPIKRYTVIGY